MKKIKKGKIHQNDSFEVKNGFWAFKIRKF